MRTLSLPAMLQRASRLYADGYRAGPFFAEVWYVFNPQGERYIVDLRDKTCECKSFLRYGQCKHLEGLNGLLDAQLAALLSYYQERDEAEARDWYVATVYSLGREVVEGPYETEVQAQKAAFYKWHAREVTVYSRPRQQKTELRRAA